MRKKNPNDVIDDYKELLDDSLDTWRKVCAALDRAELKKRVSADSFLNAAIGWESFISDWHIAAINRSSSAFAQQLSLRAKESLRSRYPGLVENGLVKIELPKHPALDLVKTLADPEGANLSMGDRARWRKRAEEELCDPYKAQVLAITTRDHKLIAAAVGIRNCLAHRSTRSADEMNERLKTLENYDRQLRPPAGRRISPSGIGHYLNAQTSTWSPRVELFHRRLSEIAEALRVP